VSSSSAPKAHRAVLSYVVVGAVCLLLAACDGPKVGSGVASHIAPPPPVQITRISTTVVRSDFPVYRDSEAHLAEGRRLYTIMKCGACHSRMDNMPAPTRISSSWFRGLDTDRIAVVIRDGRPGMPGLAGRASDSQIWQLAAFIRSVSSDVVEAQTY